MNITFVIKKNSGNFRAAIPFIKISILRNIADNCDISIFFEFYFSIVKELNIKLKAL